MMIISQFGQNRPLYKGHKIPPHMHTHMGWYFFFFFWLFFYFFLEFFLAPQFFEEAGKKHAHKKNIFLIGLCISPQYGGGRTSVLEESTGKPIGRNVGRND